MDPGTSVIKHCLGLFNFIFVVVGGAILGLGVWLVADQSSVVTLSKMADQETIQEYASGTLMEQLGWFFIVLGAFVFMISSLGYCGTMKESRVLLGMYSFFLVLIFILEIVLVVVFLVYRSEMEIETRNVLTVSLQKFYSSGDSANSFTINMDHAMAHGRCCGINNFTDFDRAEMFQKNKFIQDFAYNSIEFHVLENRKTSIPSPSQTLLEHTHTSLLNFRGQFL